MILLDKPFNQLPLNLQAAIYKSSWENGKLWRRYQKLKNYKDARVFNYFKSVLSNTLLKHSALEPLETIEVQYLEAAKLYGIISIQIIFKAGSMVAANYKFNQPVKYIPRRIK